MMSYCPNSSVSLGHKASLQFDVKRTVVCCTSSQLKHVGTHTHTHAASLLQYRHLMLCHQGAALTAQSENSRLFSSPSRDALLCRHFIAKFTRAVVRIVFSFHSSLWRQMLRTDSFFISHQSAEICVLRFQMMSQKCKCRHDMVGKWRQSA